MNPLAATILLPQIIKLIPKLLETIKEIKIHSESKKIEDTLNKASSYLESTRQMIDVYKMIERDKTLKREKINEIFDSLKRLQQSELLNVVKLEKGTNNKANLYSKFISDFNKLIHLINNNSGIILSVITVLKIKSVKFSSRQLLKTSNETTKKRYNIHS